MTRVRRLVLDLGAVLGAVCVLAALGALALDVRPVVFRSGSMAPTIDAGALALVHRVDAAALGEGDVVTVPTAAGTLVTHRIIELTRAGDGATLRLRGDANREADQQVYPVTEADRVVAAVPGLGYAVGWLTGPLGRFALGLYAAFLVMVLATPVRGAGEGPGGGQSAPGRPRVGRGLQPRTRAVAVVALVVLLGATGVVRAAAGWAAWTDGVAVSGTGLGAHPVLPPDVVECASLLASTTMSWPEKDPRYDYDVVLKRQDGTTVSTRQVTGAATSTTYTAPAGFGLDGLGVGVYLFTVEVRSYLASSTSWRGAAVRVASQRISVEITALLTSTDCVT